jgi:hypothetical protein
MSTFRRIAHFALADGIHLPLNMMDILVGLVIGKLTEGCGTSVEERRVITKCG